MQIVRCLGITMKVLVCACLASTWSFQDPVLLCELQCKAGVRSSFCSLSPVWGFTGCSGQVEDIRVAVCTPVLVQKHVLALNWRPLICGLQLSVSLNLHNIHCHILIESSLGKIYS